jgi:NAD(P)-dependent dehydrogenase (short-subunit alcohol dehydrogenase family)
MMRAGIFGIEMDRRVAFVTGASRGIGAASARALAEAGFDVAVAARTLHEGDGRVPASFASPGEPARVSGSLETTAHSVEERGARAWIVQLDLLERDSVRAAAASVREHFGRVDVLVNCGIYKGPGDQDPLLETPLELIERPIQANLVSQIALLKQIVPRMLEAGGGTVINVTSAVASLNPPGPLGRGGWGFGYGVSKGGFDRIAGLLNAELGSRGIVAYNIEPGFVVSGPAADDVRKVYPGVPLTPPQAMGAASAVTSMTRRKGMSDIKPW